MNSNKLITGVCLALEVCLGSVALWTRSPIVGVIAAIGIITLGCKFFVFD